MAEETKFEESFLDFSNIPSSMDELLQSSESTNAFTKGKIVEGKIVAKRPDGALVDIGYKAEGFVPASEFLKFDEANIGDKIDVYLEEIENRNNMPEISLEKAYSIKAWNRITTEYGEGHVVKGFMRHRVKGGIMVDVEGFPAFLPARSSMWARCTIWMTTSARNSMSRSSRSISTAAISWFPAANCLRRPSRISAASCSEK